MGKVKCPVFVTFHGAQTPEIIVFFLRDILRWTEISSNSPLKIFPLIKLGGIALLTGFLLFFFFSGNWFLFPHTLSGFNET